MIFKRKDDLAPLFAELERLLAVPNLSRFQREGLESELAAMRAGAQGEKDAAYHIDFGWKDRADSIVIHDLRIEHDGRVAQIDHLILSRGLHCHVIESKMFGGEVRIAKNGEWASRTRDRWRGIPSPVEQNNRHIEVLRSLFSGPSMLPKRLGMTFPIEFHNWVLISPTCEIRRTGEWDHVVKMDLFGRRLDQFRDETTLVGAICALSRLISVEALHELGAKLVAAHKLASFNFAGKFGIRNAAHDERCELPLAAPRIQKAATTNLPKCLKCSAGLEDAVVAFCRLNSKRYDGQLLCRGCQKTAPKRPDCGGCKGELEDKVIAFCRFNSKRFGGRMLCRGCQKTSTAMAFA